MSEVTKADLETIRTEIHKENSAMARLFIGAIISIWAVTLITASALYTIAQ